MRATSVVSTSHFKQNTNLFCLLQSQIEEQIFAMGGGRTQWEPWYVLRADGKVACKFCGTFISYQKYRLLFHLGYKGGHSLPGVRSCNKASAAVKATFFNCGGNVPTVTPDENEDVVEVTSPSSIPGSAVRGDQQPNASASANEGGENTEGQGSHVRSSEVPGPSLTHS